MSRLFDRFVTIDGDRGNAPAVRSSFRACVMDGSLDAPFAGDAAASDRRRYTVVAKTRDIAGIIPQIGDIISFTDGSRYAVTAVNPFYDRETIMDVRSC